MADNIYSKGTRVWFADKEQGWLPAEVTLVVKGDNDAIKLVFVDERGKVCRVTLPLRTRFTAGFSGNQHRNYWKRYQGWQRRPSSTAKSAIIRDRRRSCDFVPFKRAIRCVWSPHYVFYSAAEDGLSPPYRLSVFIPVF